MTAHPHHLAAGAAPLVGRMYEAAMRDDDDVPPVAPADAGVQRLPFVADILAYSPGAAVTVGRRLALDHDLFLADHNFVAPEAKPLADCFPVVPMTVSLEIMAETAACLAPGLGLLGVENVVARRWVAVADGAGLDLRIEGRVVLHDAAEGCARIAVQVHAGAGPAPAIEATLLFGSHYETAPQDEALPPADAADTLALEAAALYAGRQLFHGPRFQGLHGQVLLGPDRASATARVASAHDWFAAQPRPQLLCDPALLDTVGQLLAVWCARHGSSAFPIGVDRIDLHGPTPAPGSLVPIEVRVGERQLNMVRADVDIGDGAGGAWLRIRGWKSWEFHWAPQLVAFQRRPRHALLGEPRTLPGMGAGDVCQWLPAQRVAGFDLALLARHYLHVREMAQFAALAALPQRQREWLLGRIAAKDAARAWSAATDGGAGADGMLHPASFAVVNDERGQPRVALWPEALAAPCISIAHSEGQALALAGAGPVGIDIERIAARDAACLAAFSSATERALLAACDAAERDAWIARLWCAKEAFGKRLGSGVAGAPQDFAAQALAADGSLRLRHRPDGVETAVATVREGAFMIAVDSPAAWQSDDSEETP